MTAVPVRCARKCGEAEYIRPAADRSALINIERIATTGMPFTNKLQVCAASEERSAGELGGDRLRGSHRDGTGGAVRGVASSPSREEGQRGRRGGQRDRRADDEIALARGAAIDPRG